MNKKMRNTMQVMDEQKREKILDAAAELFARQPFHKVLLSDVAELASVGKGTLYIYFKNKEDLYLSVLYSGFSRLVDSLAEQVDEDALDPEENLETVIHGIVGFAYNSPYLFEVMRTVPGREVIDHAKWNAKRKDLKSLIESIIRGGINQGLFVDPHPDLTAKFIPGFVRSVLIDGIETIDPPILTQHILRFVRGAIMVRQGAC